MRVNWLNLRGAAGGITAAMALCASAAIADDFTVTSNADDGAGSLREAIAAANASDANPDTITIDLPAESVIALDSPLPAIAAPGPVAVVSNLEITIEASGIGESENAVTVSSPGVSLTGLRIQGAPGSGILLVAANATVSASLLDGNGTGITIDGAGNATIGGIEISARNIIINSARAGISISGNTPGFSILGNYLGVDLDGNEAGNGSVGISISGATTGQVGNLSGNGGNLISGNAQGGISINSSSGVAIRGNTIGLDPAQNLEIPNGGPGISISGGGNITIGEPGNIIAGNGGGGILLLNTSGITITSNRVGLNAGDTPFFNGGPGISLSGSTQNTIGSSASSDKGNLIAANSGPGVLLDAGSNDNQIKNNNIGLNTIFQGIGNVGDGIRIIASNGNQIGGSEANAGNIICSSVESGVEINGGVNNTLEANWIGVDPLEVSHPNSGGGVTLFGGASGNKIGNSAGAGNIIRRNSGFGVLVNGPTTTNNTIRFNSISNNTSGGISLLNGANGSTASPQITGIGSAFGTAPALALVDLYVDESTQGATYLGTVSATGAGSFFSNVDLTPYIGQFLTAIATTATGSSAFSAPFFIVIPEGAVDGEGAVEGALDGEGGIEGEGEGGTEGIVEGEGELVIENKDCPVDTAFSQPIDLTVSSFAPNSSGGPVSYENFEGMVAPIVGLRWWGTATGIFGECTSETPEFLVTFYSDDSGFPGEPVTSRIVAPTLSPTGRLIANGVEQAHDAVFDVPVSLAEGWISIENLEITGCTSNWVAASAGGGTSLTVDESGPSVVTNEFDLSLCLIGGEPLEGEGEEASPLLSCPQESALNQAVGEQVVQGGQSNSNNAFRSFEKFSGLTGEYHGLRWWGTYSSPLGGDCFAAGASFVVSLYADEENRPGALIFSEQVNPAVEATGRSAFGVNERVFDVNLVNPIAVDSGWLLIEDLNSTGCIYRWTSSPNGDGFSLTQVTTTEAYSENNFDLAYCLTPGLAPEGAQDGEGAGEGEGEGAVLEPHTADIDGDGLFSLAELLRVVQLFNADAYRCFAGEGASEDGFEPGAGDCLACGGHDADYIAGADCVVELSELLRLIQLFSLGAYGNCPEAEDGFCGLG